MRQVFLFMCIELVAISCGIILTGSRFVITGDVNGTIRVSLLFSF